MGWQAWTTAEASFDTELVMAKYTIYQYMPHVLLSYAVMQTIELFYGLL